MVWILEVIVSVIIIRVVTNTRMDCYLHTQRSQFDFVPYRSVTLAPERPCYSQHVGGFVPWLARLPPSTRLLSEVHREERHCNYTSSPLGLCTGRLTRSSFHQVLAYAVLGCPWVSP